MSTTTTMLMLTAFVPASLASIAGLKTVDALSASAGGLLTFLALCPLFGALSDRVGRRPLLLATAISATVLSAPAFLLFSLGRPLAGILGCVLLGLVLAPFGGAGAAALAELFPTGLRYSGLALGSAFAIAIAGGFSTVFFTWLVQVTGSLVSPSAVLVVLGVLSLVAVLTMGETFLAESDNASNDPFAQSRHFPPA